MSLDGLYPGLQLKATKREIASAFRLLRRHPASSLLMAAEFPANHVSFPRDLICIYLVMPFGRNGSPANFARFGDAITLDHQQCGLRKCDRHQHHSFYSRMYLGDWVFREINFDRRLASTTTCWEFFARGILGLDAINNEKSAQEGTWDPHRILIGFVFDFHNLAISLQGGNGGRAEIFPAAIFEKRGPQSPPLLETQQLRGYLYHFQTTNEVWEIAKDPSDRLLACANENGVYVRRPGPTVWGMFRESMDLIQTRIGPEDMWRSMFPGNLSRLLPRANDCL